MCRVVASASASCARRANSLYECMTHNLSSVRKAAAMGLVLLFAHPLGAQARVDH